LIIGGVDNKGGSIFVTDPSGTYVPYAAVAIGANSEEVTDFLEKNYKPEMTLQDGAALATAAINLKDEKKVGAKHVKMSWIKLDKQTFEKVPESEIEKFVKTASQKFPR
jgi:proteasome alpha subunit